VSESALSERRMLLMKGSAADRIEDVFNVSLLSNKDPVYTIKDKCMTDMLLSLFQLDKIVDLNSLQGNLTSGSSKGDVVVEEITSYIGTTLVGYLFKQLIFQQNASPHYAKLTINVNRKVNGRENLNKSLKSFMSRGMFLPLTPLHVMWYKARVDFRE